MYSHSWIDIGEHSPYTGDRLQQCSSCNASRVVEQCDHVDQCLVCLRCERCGCICRYKGS
ncbi:MAG: hypothetical protein OXG35_33875 [Acidobacteria bacterium]|nr:hypothetical protein [Acidobacteriota bacterium]